MLTLTPFDLERTSLLFAWLQEYPAANFDDYGPKDAETFLIEIERRIEVGERLWGVRKDGGLCGAIGYQPLSPRCGMFHGIVFPKGRLTRTEKRAAVSLLLTDLFASGVEKVSATYFADNLKIHQFLKDLGAVGEGLLRKQTLRGGLPVDLRLIAIFKDRPPCRSPQLESEPR